MKDRTLLIEVLVALGAGKTEIGPIHCDGELIQGCALLDGTVRINPAVEVVDTALHELLHRLRPTWSERKVRHETRQLLASLTDAEIDKVYCLVQVVAQVRKRPLRMDVD